MKYSLRLLKLAEHTVPAPEVYFMRDLDSWVSLYFYAVVAQSTEGVTVINTGLPKDFGFMADYWASQDKRVTVKRQDGEEVGDALRKTGTDPKQVERVILTPITSYTTGGLHNFTTARIEMLRRGWEDFISPRPPSVLPRNMVFPDAILRDLVTGWWDRVSLLEDTDSPAEGIKTYYVGGHHESSMLIVFETRLGRVGFTDAFFTLRNLRENIPLGVAEDLRADIRAIEFAKRSCDVVVPLYDPLLLKEFKDGIIVE